ncbi:S41 family peptidase [Alkalihalobacillus sp. MEB130]|uniref:S41 family peptidase n=1 Tax=Alkalihalobacillus sp. MEB130 TaxID=2976704 RepID=UPI0028DDC3B2|nr:S41 family peptidase [Alkalihalobacillus sp. MEB130]MDT8860376.1 S41 family peptidase [Alkalihalobacillus sp. MEB130]
MVRFVGKGILLIMLVGCSQVETKKLDEEAVKSLTAVAEKNRFYSDHLFDEVPNYLYDFSTNREEELPEDLLQTLRITNTTTPSLTKENMIEDVEVLHLTLKYMYALYEYMGGDEAFETARDEMIQTIEELPDETTIHAHQMIAMLKEHYHFIVDDHFLINHEPIVESEHRFYFSEQVRFRQLENGEYSVVGDEQVRLKEINGDHNIDSYLKPSLHDDGNLVFILGLFSEDVTSEDREWEFTFEDETTETITLDLMPNKLPRHQIGDPFALTEKEGVPWLQIRSMFAYEQAPYDYYDIINTANELKEQPYFVLDVRGNQGGSMILVDKWLEAFFDQSISWSSQSIHLFSNTTSTFVEDTIELYQSQAGLSSQTFEDDFTHLYRVEAFGEITDPQWEIDSTTMQTVQDNETHIFILVDNDTASAAEHLVSKLKLANRTTIIGVNTSGSIISGNSLMWRLPNTQIELFTPTFFNYHPDLLQKETVGIQPDLWVTAPGVESRVLAFIEEHTAGTSGLIYAK